MNVEKWPLEKIMQLPDCAFGRRFLVSCEVKGYGAAVKFDMAEIPFPDRMVIWQVSIEAYYMSDLESYIRLALGEQIVTSEAMFMLLDPLIYGYGYQGPEPRIISFFTNYGQTSLLLRMPIETKGQRLLMMSSSEDTKHAKCRVSVVVSSIPKEVPEWLISDRAGLL